MLKESGNLLEENIPITKELLDFALSNNYKISLKTGDYRIGNEFKRNRKSYNKEILKQLNQLYLDGEMYPVKYSPCLCVPEHQGYLVSIFKQQGFKTLSSKDAKILYSEEIQAKTKATCLERYEVKHPLQHPEFLAKAKSTCLLRFGVDNASKSPIIRARVEATMLERYGVKHNWAKGVLRDALEASWLEVYGVDNPLKCVDVRNKVKITNIIRYGVVYTIQLPWVREKSKQTLLKNYGVEHNWRKGIERNYKGKKFERIQLMRSQSSYEMTSDDVNFIFSYSYSQALKYANEFDIRPYKGPSVPEMKLRNLVSSWVKDLDVEVKFNAKAIHGIRYSDYDLLPEDFKLRGLMDLDILIIQNSKLVLAIECNGVAHHSINQAPRGAEPTHPEYHIIKRLLCQRNGIKLVGVMDFELRDDEKLRVLKSTIIKHLETPWSADMLNCMENSNRDQYEVKSHTYKDWVYNDYGHFIG